MDLMTQAGPQAREKLVEAITADIKLIDSGIDVVPIYTEWGVTLKFQRQGKSLHWRATMNRAGMCGIYKPKTASLPKVEQNYPQNQHLALRDDLQVFIRAGWI